MPVYVGGPIDEAAVRSRWPGPKRLDMGRSCIRFRTVDELDAPLIADALAQFTVADYIRASDAARAGRTRR